MAQLIGRYGVGQRAPGVQIGNQHLLVGTQDRYRLGHEMHAAEDDRPGAGSGGPLRETQRVANVVGHVLDLGQLVVVGEDHRAALVRQRANLLLQQRDVLKH